jgi:hypothetical protein
MSIVIPQKNLSFSIAEVEYNVEFPSNGQFIEIETMKIRLTKDTYHILSEGQTVSSQLARFTVDMIAFFSVCCPKLKENMKVASFSELDMMSSKKIMKVYMDKILPWLTDWDLVLNSIEEEEKEQKTEA